MLSGYRTQIVAAVMALATFLLQMGIIEQVAFDKIMPLLTALGLAALRAGVAKATKKE